MKPKITFVIPVTNNSQAKDIKLWLSEMPELNLLGQPEVIIVPWEGSVTGTSKDWLSVSDVIIKNWSKTHGFVIWSPPSAVLSIIGVASLAIPNGGKPIVCFAGPNTGKFSKRTIKQFGLKSQLINAGYVALSDLAQIFVLAENNLYDPSFCYWQNGSSVACSQDPFAQIGFSLDVKRACSGRGKVDLPKLDVMPFKHKVVSLNWYPGCDINIGSIKVDALVVSLSSNFWGDEQFKAFRKKLIAKIKVVWHSTQPWSELDLSDNEVVVTHDQAWWVNLSVQFALSQGKKLKSVFK